MGDLSQSIGLWKHLSKNNNNYYRGTLGPLVITIMPNKKAEENPKAPDLHLFFSNKKYKSDAVDNELPSEKEVENLTSNQLKPDEFKDEDLPF